MIQLVLVYCLMSDLKSCVEKQPVMEIPLTPISCVQSAQPAALDYLREHPAYRLSSFRCEINKPPEKQA